MKFLDVMPMDDSVIWKRIDYPAIGGSPLCPSVEITHVLRWLKEHESDGKFVLGGRCIWFSKEEDATMFTLKWV